MALTDKQRAELEALGLANVQIKLAQPGHGRGAALSGFTSGEITRGDVEDWAAGFGILVSIGIAVLQWLTGR